MVYETRPGEAFRLGASTWRVEDITFDRVIVTPAPGVPAKMPFWHGDRLGRPVELGRAVGSFIRTVSETQSQDVIALLQTEHFLDQNAAETLVAYIEEQRAATGVIPDDKTIVVERFRDDIGDWRICIHSPFGTPVHAPWAMAIEHSFLERHGVAIETMWGDDGIVIRLPEANDEFDVNDFLLEPEEVRNIVVSALPQTSLFAARFRECAARALLLPRRRPGQRTPLWQQRQRSADLLAVAAKYPSFPILLETSRECLQDVFDVPGLCDLLTRLRARSVRIVAVDTPKASPFAQSLLFNWIASYMYEGDAPLAERRAAALSLDRDLLNSLLGAEELRELLDADALVNLELELQCVADDRRARNADELHDVLRKVGDLSLEEIDFRCERESASWLQQLIDDRRVVSVRIGDDERFITAEDAGKYRDALGCALPLGLPTAFTEPVSRPLEELVGRFARTHGPFLSRQIATRFHVGVERIDGVLMALENDKRIVRGEFRPDGTEREWCDVSVLSQLRRRSLAVLRREVEPVEQQALGRFLPHWHNIGTQRRGVDALVSTLTTLQGASLIASTLELDVLPQRIRGYRASDLDELCTAGEVIWVGAGALGASDGRIRFFFADQLAVLAPSLTWPESPSGPLHDAIRGALTERGALFFSQLRAVVPDVNEQEVLQVLWDLVWAGEVTNDSLAPLRAYITRASTPASVRRNTHTGRSGRPRPGRLSRIGPPMGAGRWSIVAPLRDPVPSITESTHALALQMLERYGVVTREAILSDEVVGGFAGLYGVLKVLEERGVVRRGYFVEGLGAAQFAAPGAVDRLRDLRTSHVDSLHDDPVSTIVLAATDPSQPYGASIPWPMTDARPSRSAGTLVVLRDGEPLLWIDPRSHHVVTFPCTFECSDWADALAGLVKDSRRRTLEIRKVNGTAIGKDHELVSHLERVGFIASYRGWVLRD
jgi:ATP-dependent Lhr-like helicase